MLRTTLPDLVAQAFEAACDPSRLQPFMAAVSEYFGADSAAYLVWPHRHPELALRIRHGVDDALLSAWLGESDQPGSLFGRLVRETPGTLLGQAPGGTSGWPPCPFLATLVVADHESVHALLLFNQHRTDSFSEADRDALRQLTGYLRRATTVNHHFVTLASEHSAARQLIDGAPRGIVIFGQDGRVTYSNQAAREILANNRCLSIEAERLALGTDAAQAEVESFLGAARTADESAPPQPIGLRIDRGDARAACQLILYALPRDPQQAAINPRHALAIGMIHDPEKGALPADDLLAIFFGLTPAEAQLAQALCQGLSVSDIAAQLSVSVHTARTHLRNIFNKVGVHSQHALVQRISQSLHINEIAG